MKGYLFALIFFAFLLYACEETIDEFSGFQKQEMEFLLAGDSAKVWERVSRWEDGVEVEFSDCEKQNRMLFIAGNNDESKRLLYTFDTEVCDSESFCNENIKYCISDTAQCNRDPDFCELLDEGTLYLGTWEVKEPASKGGTTDQLLIKLWPRTRITTVTSISSLAFSYEFSELEANGTINVKEDYILLE